MVLDTETIGSLVSPIVHNIGWHCEDKLFNTMTEKDYRVSELHYQHPELLETSEFYVAHRISSITPARRYKTIMTDLARDLRKNNIKTIAAYNLPFDYRAIKGTAKFFGLEDDKNVKYILSRNMLDIWGLAKQTICKEAGYLNFIDNIDGGRTARGTPRTNVETVYRYLTNSVKFEERHTALSDCCDEAFIMNYILKQYKGISTYYIPKDRG